MRICAREMTDQGAHRSRGTIEYEGKMRREESVRRRVGYDRSEWVRLDERE
jgi:hypothetical protein